MSFISCCASRSTRPVFDSVASQTQGYQTDKPGSSESLKEPEEKQAELDAVIAEVVQLHNQLTSILHALVPPQVCPKFQHSGVST